MSLQFTLDQDFDQILSESKALAKLPIYYFMKEAKYSKKGSSLGPTSSLGFIHLDSIPCSCVYTRRGYIIFHLKLPDLPKTAGKIM